MVYGQPPHSEGQFWPIQHSLMLDNRWLGEAEIHKKKKLLEVQLSGYYTQPAGCVRCQGDTNWPTTT